MVNQDRGYKKLFSNKEMVRDLLVQFVDPEIVRGLNLDLDAMVREHSDFVTDDLRERIDDVVWRVELKERALYLCILIEFQSAEDKWMAVRLLTYVGLLYDDLLKRRLVDDEGLPPVLPVVVHTGIRRWNAPCSLKELSAPVSSALSRYAPSLDYLLLDAAACTDEELSGTDNLAALLFRMEKSRAPEELVDQIRRLDGALRGDGSAHLRRAFAVFLTRVLLPRKTGLTDMKEALDLVEVERMVVERQPEWAEHWLKEGEERGIKLGEQRGIRLGEQRGRRLGADANKRANALRMLDKGFSIPDVAECVDLPEEEVRRMADSARN